MATMACRDCEDPLTEENHKEYHKCRCRDCYNRKARERRKRRYETRPEFREKEQARARERLRDPEACASYLGKPCMDCTVPLTEDNHKDYTGPRCKVCYRKVKRDRKRVKYQADPEFREKLQERCRQYHKDPEKRALINERRRKHYAEDPIFRLRINLSNRINDALKSESKSANTEWLIGMPFDQFKDWIETQFEPDMTWDNHGDHWEIDHVRPCASFDLTEEAQQRACFNWSNQRPTRVSENREKEDKLLPALIAQHAEKVAIYADRHSLDVTSS